LQYSQNVTQIRRIVNPVRQFLAIFEISAPRLYMPGPMTYRASHMDMSPFEILMLVCFGMAWPFSIYKSYTTWQVGSKSLVFLVALFIGYISGVLHKIFFLYDPVIFLYMLNGTMVGIDIALYLRNRMYQVRKSAEEAERRRAGDAGAGGVS
jgi:hypothetical protein